MPNNGTCHNCAWYDRPRWNDTFHRGCCSITKEDTSEDSYACYWWQERAEDAENEFRK